MSARFATVLLLYRVLCSSCVHYVGVVHSGSGAGYYLCSADFAECLVKAIFSSFRLTEKLCCDEDAVGSVRSMSGGPVAQRLQLEHSGTHSLNAVGSCKW